AQALAQPSAMPRRLELLALGPSASPAHSVFSLSHCHRALPHVHSSPTRRSSDLRPHAKSHKCAEIARRQIAVGAVGVCNLGALSDRKSTRLNSSHGSISSAVFCSKKRTAGSA